MNAIDLARFKCMIKRMNRLMHDKYKVQRNYNAAFNSCLDYLFYTYNNADIQNHRIVQRFKNKYNINVMFKHEF